MFSFERWLITNPSCIRVGEDSQTNKYFCSSDSPFWIGAATIRENSIKFWNMKGNVKLCLTGVHLTIQIVILSMLLSRGCVQLSTEEVPYGCYLASWPGYFTTWSPFLELKIPVSCSMITFLITMWVVARVGIQKIYNFYFSQGLIWSSFSDRLETVCMIKGVNLRSGYFRPWLEMGSITEMKFIPIRFRHPVSRSHF